MLLGSFIKYIDYESENMKKSSDSFRYKAIITMRKKDLKSCCKACSKAFYIIDKSLTYSFLLHSQKNAKKQISKVSVKLLKLLSSKIKIVSLHNIVNEHENL